MNQGNGSVLGFILFGFLFLGLIGSCTTNTGPDTNARVDIPKNDYQDMRDRGHSEEDAVIFSILKQQGYSDYDAINATKASSK